MDREQREQNAVRRKANAPGSECCAVLCVRACVRAWRVCVCVHAPPNARAQRALPVSTPPNCAMRADVRMCTLPSGRGGAPELSPRYRMRAHARTRTRTHAHRQRTHTPTRAPYARTAHAQGPAAQRRWRAGASSCQSPSVRYFLRWAARVGATHGCGCCGTCMVPCQPMLHEAPSVPSRPLAHSLPPAPLLPQAPQARTSPPTHSSARSQSCRVSQGAAAALPARDPYPPAAANSSSPAAAAAAAAALAAPSSFSAHPMPPHSTHSGADAIEFAMDDSCLTAHRPQHRSSLPNMQSSKHTGFNQLPLQRSRQQGLGAALDDDDEDEIKVGEAGVWAGVGRRLGSWSPKGCARRAGVQVRLERVCKPLGCSGPLPVSASCSEASTRRPHRVLPHPSSPLTPRTPPVRSAVPGAWAVWCQWCQSYAGL